jgi:hypothetical protein
MGVIAMCRGGAIIFEQTTKGESGMSNGPISRRPFHSLGGAPPPGRALLSGVVIVLAVAVAGSSGAQSGLIAKDDFVYLGAFKLECDDDACSYNLTDLGTAPNGGLWVTDHVYDYAVRRIGILEVPLDSHVFDALPEAPTLEGPLATGGCPGSSTDISGVEGVGVEPASTCRDWYNVTGEYGPVFYRSPGASIEEIGPRADPFHPNKFGAYLFALPSDWVADQGLGLKTLVTGFSREAGANGGSQGPALFAFDPDNPVDAIDLLYYREIYPGCPYEGNCDFVGYESADSWMGADWVRSGNQNAILVAGVKAGSTCYGEAVECGDPCRSSKGYHGYPYTAKILFYDPTDLEAWLRGEVEPFEILPYAEWTPEELWAQECPSVGGMAFDESSGRLYLAERSAGPFGRGIIHVYQLEDFVFADGFETGDASRWSGAQMSP